ncbi:MAG: carboxypeptidase-like regulatory domain-containing protein [Bacteroidota bacterium]
MFDFCSFLLFLRKSADLIIAQMGLRRIFLKIKITIVLIALLAASQSLAQVDCEGKIIGKILDKDTNKPLPFATIKILNSDNGTISDEAGSFTLTDICGKEVDFEVRFLGYKTIIHHHDFRSGKSMDENHIIYLAPEQTELESITVESERLDEIKSLAVQKKELTNMETLGSSLADISEEITGVSLLKSGSNIAKPIVHGLHSNRVLVINDGVRHGYQAWGEEHGPEIDPSHVDLIEVVKGAGTVKYGPDALGGVVLYNAKKPAFNNKLNGSFGSSYQTNGRAISSQLDLGQGSDRFAWNVGGHGVYQGDLHAPDYNLSNTGKREYGVSFNTLLHRPTFDLQVAGSYFDQELGILRASIVGNLADLDTAINRNEPDIVWPFTYDLQSPWQDIEHAMLKADLSLYLGEHVFNFQYGVQRNNRKEFDVRRGELNDRPVIKLRLWTHTLDAEWTQPTKGRWQGNSGVQLISQNSDNLPEESNKINFIPDYDVLNIGAFTVQSYEINKGLLELGVRFDFQQLSVSDSIKRNGFTYSNEINFSNATYTLGVRKELKDGLTVYSNIGYAWRPPNVAELYSFGYRYSRLQYGLWRYDFENPDLRSPTPPDTVFNQTLRTVDSERGVKWISGIEVKKRKISADFIFYINQINNYIFLRPYGLSTTVAGVFPFFLYEQTDAIFYGTDWDIRYKHDNIFTSEVKVSYVHARSVDREQPLLEIPPLNISYSLEFKKGPWDAALSLSYTAEQWDAPPVIAPGDIQDGNTDVDRNTVLFDFMAPPDGYLLLGSNISYKKKAWNVAFNVDNLLNTSYRIYTDRLRYFADAPGRNFTLAVEYSF